MHNNSNIFKYVIRRCRLLLCVLFIFAGASHNASRASSYGYSEKVHQHLNTLLMHDKDTYGSTTTPLFMSVLDDDTLVAPSSSSYAMYLNRMTDEQRALGGSNLWWQGDLMRLLYRMSGYDAAFDAAADDHLCYYLDHFSNYTEYGNDNMICWGDHLYYDAFADTILAPVKPEHQINNSFVSHLSLWDHMWRLRQDTTVREANEIWRMHVFNKDVGKWDRHARNQEHWAVGFAEAGSSFITAFIFMYDKTCDPAWKYRAQLLRDHMWNERNTDTNIIPNVANTDWERTEGFYLRNYQDRAAVGMWVPMLVYGYKVFGDAEWLNQAEAISQAMLKYAYNPNAKAFYKFIRIDGVYVTDDPNIEPGYSYFWRNESNFRNNSMIGIGLLDAYEVSRKPFLLNGAKLLGDELLTTEPHSDSSTGGNHGSFGEYYAAAINILMRLHRITNDQRYLDRAIFMANHAVSWLWNDNTKIFRGHYYHGYEASDGSDKLCNALLDLDSYIDRNTLEPWHDDFKEDSLLAGRWSQISDEHTSCWIDTLGTGKLVIRDDNANGKTLLKRSFAKAQDNESLKISFTIKITRRTGNCLVIKLNGDNDVNGIIIKCSQVNGVYQWLADNGQFRATGKEFIEGQTYAFDVLATGSEASIWIDGAQVLTNLALNNSMLAGSLSALQLESGIEGESNTEFDQINIDTVVLTPDESLHTLSQMSCDWLKKYGNAPPAMPPASPQVWYKLDQTTGSSAADAQAYANGMLVNFPQDNTQWVKAQYAGGLKFDGINDWVDIADSAISDFHNKTISMWIKVDAPPAAASYLFGTKSGYRIYIRINTDMSVDAQLASAPVIGKTVIIPGIWVHLALVLRDTADGLEAADFYVDGVPRGSTTGFIRHAGILAGANIGSYNNGVSGFAAMTIDDFRVYDRPLTENSIVWLATSPADLDKNGTVNFSDLAIIAQNWALSI